MSRPHIPNPTPSTIRVRKFRLKNKIIQLLKSLDITALNQIHEQINNI
jgi:hypothetical protein